ncbi:WD40 repeat domain-containing protein [Spartinivicinus poritis]|uniref:WD40 repeat domain-containing protein n=1 Tax=Spartinivicinus poritis TaxID=2994640 RepID=A0ABT5UFV7_9GAMM|nr:hypothetical protein [Spartinivicinus sp. A2-2]MDE1465233.1 hypothetical protein [Spartinivicinus sp. A2-2]
MLYCQAWSRIQQKLTAYKLKELPIIIVWVLLLTGCTGSDEDKLWELALQGYYSSALSSDGNYAVIGSIYHGGSCWELPKSERLYDWNHAKEQLSNLVSVDVAGNNLVAATVDDLRTIVLWDLATGKSLAYWQAPGEVSSLSLTQDGGLAFLGISSDTRAIVFNIKQGGIVRTVEHEDRVNDVAISAGGDLGITGSDDFTAKLWNLNTGEMLHSWDLGNKITTVELSPDGFYAFISAQSGLAQIRETGSGKLVHELNEYVHWMQRGDTYTSARFSVDSSQLLTGSNNREIKLYQVKDKKILKRWTVSKRSWWLPTGVAMQSVAFGEKMGTYYALGSNGYAYLLKK